MWVVRGLYHGTEFVVLFWDYSVAGTLQRNCFGIHGVDL